MLPREQPLARVNWFRLPKSDRKPVGWEITRTQTYTQCEQKTIFSFFFYFRYTHFFQAILKKKREKNARSAYTRNVFLSHLLCQPGCFLICAFLCSLRNCIKQNELGLPIHQSSIIQMIWIWDSYTHIPTGYCDVWRGQKWEKVHRTGEPSVECEKSTDKRHCCLPLAKHSWIKWA